MDIDQRRHNRKYIKTLLNRAMIEAIFGNKTAAKVMLYLFHYGEAYANGLARDMNITLSQVQKQLDKFEFAGISVRIYFFNPKLGVTKKIKELIQVFYNSIPLEQREEMFHERRSLAHLSVEIDVVCDYC